MSTFYHGCVMDASMIPLVLILSVIYIGLPAVAVCVTRRSFLDDRRVGRLDFSRPGKFVVLLGKGERSYKALERAEAEAQRAKEQAEHEARMVEDRRKHEETMRLLEEALRQQRIRFNQQARQARQAYAAAPAKLRYFDGCSDARAIKQRYRKLARKLHPDTNAAANAAEQFRAMQDEYDALSASIA